MVSPLKQSIERISQLVQQRCEHDTSGHDWLHIKRVVKTALSLAAHEKANPELTELIALLHDVEDHKLVSEEDKGLVSRWLEEENVGPKLIARIDKAINEISFKGAGVATPVSSIEAACVQDADRLDALGAIGIGRTFAYGGHVGQPMYDPKYDAKMHSSFGEYKSHKGNTIGHFYEKLLLLKDRMNTNAGRKEALKRHNFMTQFLDQWNVETSE